MFVCPFLSPDDVQSIISGKLALRYSGSQVSKTLILLCLTLNWLSVKYCNDYQWTGMLLRTGCRLISPAEKDLTISSNCSGKQRHGVILKEQWSKKATLTNWKACLAFPQLHPWVKSPLNLQSNHIFMF